MSTTPTTTKPILIDFSPHQIDPSPFQSRKEFEPAKLAELTASVREHGIIQPLVARYPAQVPLDGIERLELVAGERRMRAAIAAGLELVPVLVSVISDATAEAMVLTENLQREGLTPAEEAHAFERLLKLKGEQGEVLYTQQSLAKMVSKDVEYIVARLKLLLCPAELVKAVNEGLVSVSTAMLVGRVPDPKARAACAKLVLEPEHQQVPLNCAQTKEFIREHFMVRLDGKHFDLADPNLVPAKLDDDQQRCQGGDCMSCPFRSGNMEGVTLQQGAPRKSVVGVSKGGSSKGADAMLCTLPRCHKLKLDAQWAEEKLKAERGGMRTLDGAAAKKAFSGHNGSLRYDEDLTLLDDDTYVNGKPVKYRVLLKGREFQTTLARHPDTHQLIELVLKKDVEAARKEKAGIASTGGTTSPQDVAAEKERRQEEIKKQKIEKIATKEGITEIRTALSTGRVKVGEDLLERLFDCALDAAGSDGIKLIADTLEIERDKKQGGYGLDKPVKKWVKANVTTAPQWLSMLVFAMLARKVAWNGTSCEHFKALLGLCGLKVPDLEKRAKTLLDADKKGKGKGKSPAEDAPPQGGNSTDPNNFTLEGENSKTAAADAVAKAGGKQGKVAVDESPAPVSGPSASETVTGIQDSKIGKPGMWTPADVEAGAKLLKAKTHKVGDLLGPAPAKSDANARKKWDAVRLAMLRRAGKTK